MLYFLVKVIWCFWTVWLYFYLPSKSWNISRILLYLSRILKNVKITKESWKDCIISRPVAKSWIECQSFENSVSVSAVAGKKGTRGINEEGSQVINTKLREIGKVSVEVDASTVSVGWMSLICRCELVSSAILREIRESARFMYRVPRPS